MEGLTFIGQIDGAHVKAALYLNEDVVTIEGPVWFTLDQWQELRRLGEQADGDVPIWATTPVEYVQSTGETAPVS